MFRKRDSNALLVLAGLLACSACSAPRENAVQATSAPFSVQSPLSTANGRAIFQTGKDLGGVQIQAKPATTYLSCARCHRANGSGGMHLSGGAISADLRYKSLVTQQKHPYTVPLLERAISNGIDNEGKLLDPVMPRWKLSRQDLHDVAVYVATQLK
jgi:mono/diheme cytochrome c family protein